MAMVVAVYGVTIMASAAFLILLGAARAVRPHLRGARPAEEDPLEELLPPPREELEALVDELWG